MSEERKAFERLIGRILVAVVVTVAAWLLIPVCWNYLSPFIIAFPVAAILNPVTHFLERKLKFKRTPAVIIPLLLFVGILVGLLCWFAAFGINRIVAVLQNPTALINDLVTMLRNGFNQIIGFLDAETVSPEIITWLNTSLNDALSWLRGALMTLASSALSITVNMAAGIPYAFIYANFLVMAFYFVTKDYDNIRALLPGGRKHDPDSSTTKLTNSAVVGLIGYLRMQTTYGLLSLIISSIYFQCFHFDYAFLIALVAATFEFLPLLGNGTLYIPWSLLAFVLGDFRTGTLVIVLYLLFIIMRRITEPMLLSNSIGVSPFASLVGMFVGLKAGGLLGLIGGPVVMSVLAGVWHGHYLDPTIRDIRLVAAYIKQRLAPSAEVAAIEVHTIFDNRQPEQRRANRLVSSLRKKKNGQSKQKK